MTVFSGVSVLHSLTNSAIVKRTILLVVITTDNDLIEMHTGWKRYKISHSSKNKLNLSIHPARQWSVLNIGKIAQSEQNCKVRQNWKSGKEWQKWQKWQKRINRQNGRNGKKGKIWHIEKLDKMRKMDELLDKWRWRRN